jgi:hypothetical protein
MPEDVKPEDKPVPKQNPRHDTKQNPQEEDPVLALMRALKVPLTRQKYMELNYMGKPPAELSPEEEAALPAEFQKKDGVEPMGEIAGEPTPNVEPTPKYVEPPYRGGSRGLSPEELAWHRSRKTPVTGSAFKDDPDPSIVR